MKLLFEYCGQIGTVDSDVVCDVLDLDAVIVQFDILKGIIYISINGIVVLVLFNGSYGILHFDQGRQYLV